MICTHPPTKGIPWMGWAKPGSHPSGLCVASAGYLKAPQLQCVSAQTVAVRHVGIKRSGAHQLLRLNSC